MFDPHSVTTEKIYDCENGLTRFFTCSDTKTLAALLLQGHPRDNANFEVVRINVEIVLDESSIFEPSTSTHTATSVVPFSVEKTKYYFTR